MGARGTLTFEDVCLHVPQWIHHVDRKFVDHALEMARDRFHGSNLSDPAVKMAAARWVGDTVSRALPNRP
jgi:hypothetical protein